MTNNNPSENTPSNKVYLYIIIATVIVFISIIFVILKMNLFVDPLKQEIDNLNKKLPQQIDNVTILNKVTLKNSDITYIYSINNISKSKLEEFKQSNLKPILALKGCLIFKETSSAKSINYKYYLEDETIIKTEKITKNDCKKYSN